MIKINLGKIMLFVLILKTKIQVRWLMRVKDKICICDKITIKNREVFAKLLAMINTPIIPIL